MTDPVLGEMRKPGCENPESKEKYNKLGLRDRDYEKPQPGVVRILVMGSELATESLPADQTPARRLEALLQSQKLKVEVIDGAMPGFFSPRNALFAEQLAKAYSPHIVIYYQSPEGFENDAAEWAKFEFDTNGKPARYTGVDRSPWLEGLSRVRLNWRMKWEEGGKSKLLSPSITSLRRINSLLGVDARMIVTWEQMPVQAWAPIPGLGGFGNGVLRFLSPTIQLSVPELVKTMSWQNAIQLYNLPRLEKQNGTLTLESSKQWAETVATGYSEVIRAKVYGLTVGR